MKEKKEFQKPEAEVIELDKNIDTVTISGTGQNPYNPPDPNNDPPIPGL